MQARTLLAWLIIAVVSMPAAGGEHWIGTWATAAQPELPDGPDRFRDQSVRLIVHLSAGGKRLRVRLSNLYGDRPLVIGSAGVARRARDADIVAGTHRPLTFGGKPSVSIASHAELWSDPVDLVVSPLSDLAITLYLPGETVANTSHALAMQTSYVSPAGDATGARRFPVERTLSSWPFLAGVDVAASEKGLSIVAFGSSLTDGDGSSKDANRRYPDVLAARLQQAFGPNAEIGVLNLGLIGNRLLHDSPRSPKSPFGRLLGEAGMKRWDREVLTQSGVRYVLVALGVNDITFSAFPFTPKDEYVTSKDLIGAYRQLIASAHAKGVRVIGTTIPPWEGAKFESVEPAVDIFTPERERIRSEVNEWIRNGGEFDGYVDFDKVVRDPGRPTRLLPAFADTDKLHGNDAGYAAQANAIPLQLLGLSAKETATGSR